MVTSRSLIQKQRVGNSDLVQFIVWVKAPVLEVFDGINVVAMSETSKAGLNK